MVRGSPPAFLFFFLTLALHAAPPVPLQLKWSELKGAANGRQVIVDLKDSSHVNATITSVEPSSLSLQVTSNSGVYKKGQVSIARGDVSGLRFISMRVRGRVIGTSVGSVLGLGGGGLVVLAASDICLLCFQPSHPNHFGQAGGVALMIGLPVAGYFVGKRTDRHEVAITILPD